MERGILYIVATPIGNLEDMTLRALRILKEVDVVFAEDTRVTKKLLSHYDIHTSVERLDAKVEGTKGSEVIRLLEEGKNAALVSDAGTPGISDPGSRLVRTVRDVGLRVETIPGPSALTAALSIAGVPADEFIFLGFPPHKKGRETFFKRVLSEERTVVFYESTHRILKALESLGNESVIVLRELTKIYEEVLEGTAQQILEILKTTPEKQKGEFVVIVP